MRVRILAGAALLVLVVGGVYLFWTNRIPFSELPPPVGSKAPKIDLADSSGRMVHLGTHRGSPVLIYFWANWCPPCKDQLEVFEAVFREFEHRGLAVIGVAIDEVPEGMAEARGISFPLVRVNARVRKAYGDIKDVPATFLVDGDGFIVNKSRDYLSREHVSELLARLLPPS